MRDGSDRSQFRTETGRAQLPTSCYHVRLARWEDEQLLSGWTARNLLCDTLVDRVRLISTDLIQLSTPKYLICYAENGVHGRHRLRWMIANSYHKATASDMDGMN